MSRVVRLLDRVPIRWKLAGGSALLTLVILMGFAVIVGTLTANRIRSDFAQETARAATDLQGSIEARVDPNRGVFVYSRPNLAVFATADDSVIRVTTRDNSLLREYPRGAPDFGLLPDGGTVTGGYRIETRTVPLTVGGSVVVQYARPVASLEETVARVRFFLVSGVLGGAALALIAGLFIAGRAMLPVSRLTETAREIARTRDTNRRVPVSSATDEVSELARTLDEMLLALESSRAETAATLARQRQFVADASHELRTPLTSVLANLELLADDLDGDRGEAARSALRSSHRMRRLVADLLLLARADTGRQIPHVPTDVAEVILDVASELGPVAEDHHLRVEADGPAIVSGAPDELHRLVLNLMENSVRHTPAGSHVEAVVTHEDGHVRIVVEDDGPGVPAALRPRLFERFVRGGGDRAGSTGLGLAIVRAVAESHGGTVRLEDPEPHGTRFVVTLPAAAVPADPAPAGTVRA